jgi:hypothetical protein
VYTTSGTTVIFGNQMRIIPQNTLIAGNTYLVSFYIQGSGGSRWAYGCFPWRVGTAAGDQSSSTPYPMTLSGAGFSFNIISGEGSSTSSLRLSANSVDMANNPFFSVTARLVP